MLLTLEYADAITDTAQDVDDPLFARVREHYDEEQIAELTMLIAWEPNKASGGPKHEGLKGSRWLKAPAPR
jgi:hypothetical protein